MIHCLDTSYILALELTSDQYHRPAQQHWQQLRANLPPMLTSTYVFDEIVTFLVEAFCCRNLVVVAKRRIKL